MAPAAGAGHWRNSVGAACVSESPHSGRFGLGGVPARGGTRVAPRTGHHVSRLAHAGLRVAGGMVGGVPGVRAGRSDSVFRFCPADGARCRPVGQGAFYRLDRGTGRHGCGRVHAGGPRSALGEPLPLAGGHHRLGPGTGGPGVPLAPCCFGGSHRGGGRGLCGTGLARDGGGRSGRDTVQPCHWGWHPALAPQGGDSGHVPGGGPGSGQR